MSGMVEVRPDSVRRDELEAFERALEARLRPIGQTPRLVGPDGQGIELPHEIHALLMTVVEHLKAGNGISIIPLHAELTTVEAANLLNVSRPHLIKQIEAGLLPHHMVGTHRRLRLADVLAYRDRLDAQSSEALDAMAADAEELGLYDE
jgi:excisionase family DNA binding protein